MDNSELNRRTTEKLLKKIVDTREQEISCDECFEVLDVFAELAASGKDPANLMPLVQHHLDMCSDCQQEFEALLDVLEHFNKYDLL